MTLNIGSIQLDTPVVQAPLSGYTDRAMRTLSRRYGCPLTHAGVMLDKITLHPRVLRKKLFRIDDDEHPIGAQILGTDPATMAFAARTFRQLGYDLIDINLACPAPKVLRRGRGGALLASPWQCRRIMQAVRNAVEGPVTLKLRIGCTHSQADYDAFHDICAHAIAEGLDAITIHGRTVEQRYKGQADWAIPTAIKREFPHATIIGSGDLFTTEEASSRLRDSGLDGIAIARGAIGNPWLFAELRALLNGQPIPPNPTIQQQGQVILDHFHMLLEDMPANKAVIHMRKFLIRYARRHPQRKTVHMDLLLAETPQAVLDRLAHWYQLDPQTLPPSPSSGRATRGKKA